MALADNLNNAAAALLAENTQLQALIAQFQGTIPAEAMVADIVAGTADNLYISPAKFLAALTAVGGTSWKQAIVNANKIPANNFFLNLAGGNDANDGLTSATAFGTLQGAVDYISKFASTTPVTINISGGTLVAPAAGYIAKMPPSAIRSWNLVGAGRDATILDASAIGARGINVAAGVSVNISGLTIKSYYEGVVGNGTVVLSGSLGFFKASTAAQAIAAYTGASFGLYGADVIFSGAGQSDLSASYGGQIGVGYHDVNNTLPTSITFSSSSVGNAVVGAGPGGGQVIFTPGQVTWTGTPTGRRFYCDTGGGVNTAGAGVNFIPGTVAGVADASTYGWYK